VKEPSYPSCCAGRRPSLAPPRGLVEEKGERETSDSGFLDLSDLKEQLFIIMNRKYKILLKQK